MSENDRTQIENEEALNTALADAPAHIKVARSAVENVKGLTVPAVGSDAAPKPTAIDPVEFDREGNRIVAKLGRLDIRQSERLPPGYKARPVGEMSFDPRLAYEIALEIDQPAEIFHRYGYEADAAVALSNDPVFTKTVTRYREEVKESGISFKLKAKIQAEDLLTHSYALATDPDTPAAVRADMIKWTAKMAEYEPKDATDKGGGGGNFALNITFAGGGQAVLSASADQDGDGTVVIEHEGDK